MNRNLHLFRKTENKNLSSGRSWYSKVLAALLIFIFGYVSAQIKKLDPRFETLINESKNWAQRGDAAQKQQELEKELQLDTHFVVTGKGAQKMYSCIVYTNAPEHLRTKGVLVQSVLPKFVTAMATLADIEQMSNMPEVTAIVAPAFDELHNDVSRIQSGAQLLQQGVLNNTSYAGQGVLVGVYDSGIDWKHPTFRDLADPTKSRIVSIWDQTLTPITGENSPTGFNRGVEYTRADIEAELKGTKTGFIRQNDINGHGTHVAGTAAGNGGGLADYRHAGFASKADIVFVKGGDGSFPQTNTIDAITYFQQVATALNKPIVVNMSIGGQGSAHDGTSPHELAIDNFTASAPGRVSVISAGNDYGKNIHRKMEIAGSQTASFELTSANNTTANVFSFYMYADKDTDLTAKLITPDGLEYAAPISNTTTVDLMQNNFKATIYNYVSAANNKRYIQVVIARNGSSTANAAGTYTIKLENNSAETVTVHGYKVSEGAATTLTDADNEYIVGSPGNATSAITVASYIGRLTWYKTATPPGGYVINSTIAEGISSFSAQGPRTDGFLKPDLAASGQNVISAMSGDALLPSSSSDNIDGQYYRKNQGTSMSAPGVAGAVALLLQANPQLTAAQVKERLQQNARQEEITGEVPNTRWGYGKLDIYKAVADETGCRTSEMETIIYDKQFYVNSDDQNSTSTGQIFAVRFTPARTGKLGSVLVYTGSGNPSDIPLTFQVRKVEAGKPGTVLATKVINSLVNNIQRSAWNAIDLSEFNLDVTTGEDFFITLDASAGSMPLRREKMEPDNRSFYSTDQGATWQLSESDYRIRAVVYEHLPQVKALAINDAEVSQQISAGKNYMVSACDLIARIETENIATTQLKTAVWLSDHGTTHVARRYGISGVGGSAAAGKVTLYFTQAEFDAYNVNNTKKLPAFPHDTEGKNNVLVDIYAGFSNDNSGHIASFTNGFSTVAPGAEHIRWNPTYGYWEVDVTITGDAGLFVRTSSSLGVAQIDKALISVYPNPVKDMLYINHPSKQITVSIFDMSGKLVDRGISKDQKSFKVSQLPKGVYTVELTDHQNQKTSVKIIKQ